jgi:(1->4)-alpha-D-glucan 1-alpha-D-glucosylmutase
LLYQTLLGTWPVDPAGVPLSSASEQYVARIQQYMAKALHEAKINTSWIQPNAEWDNAMSDFIVAILQSGARNRFIPSFLPVAEEITRLGAINSLAQTVVKLTSPGVPDIYQGTEIWDDSLVDPDNRRPVDYARRQSMLAEAQAASPEELMRCWASGRIKLRVVERLLHLRRENPELFRSGSYESLGSAGQFASCVISFARAQLDKTAVVIVPRLSSRVGFPPIGERWGDTMISLPDRLGAQTMRDVFVDREVPMNNAQIKLSDAMAQLPFAVLMNL